MSTNNTPGMPRTFYGEEIEGMKYKYLYKLIKEKLKTDDSEPQNLRDKLPKYLGQGAREAFVEGFLTGMSSFSGFIIVDGLQINKAKDTELFVEFMELANYMKEHGDDHKYLSTLHIYCGFDEDPVYLIEEVNGLGIQQCFMVFPKIDYTNTVYFTGNDPQGR